VEVQIEFVDQHLVQSLDPQQVPDVSHVHGVGHLQELVEHLAQHASFQPVLGAHVRGLESAIFRVVIKCGGLVEIHGLRRYKRTEWFNIRKDKVQLVLLEFVGRLESQKIQVQHCQVYGLFAPLLLLFAHLVCG